MAYQLSNAGDWKRVEKGYKIQCSGQESGGQLQTLTMALPASSYKWTWGGLRESKI